MTLPTIHRNGTSREALLQSYQEAYSSLREAIVKFDNIEFSPRDYYPQGDAAWQDAVVNRDMVAGCLQTANLYLEEHVSHLFDSQP